MKTKYQNVSNGILSFPVPEATETYVPVSNRQLLIEIVNRAKDSGLRVTSQQYRAVKSGLFTGKLAFSPNLPDHKDHLGFMVAFVNSYDKSRALTIAAGASVFICSNGMVVGEVTMVRKHTGEVIKDMQTLLDNAFEKQKSILVEANTFREHAIDHRLTKRKVSHILGEMFYEKELLTPVEVNAVINEISTSDFFSMNEEKSMHVWNLYNNVTEVLKHSHPRIAVTRDSVIHKYFNGDVLGNPVVYDEDAFSFSLSELNEAEKEEEVWAEV